MKDVNPVIAALNDEKKFNDESVVKVLIEVLLETGFESVELRDFYSELYALQETGNGPKSELVEEMLSYLKEQDLGEYRDYISKMKRSERHFIPLFDSRYPENLWKLDDQPLALFVDGKPTLNQNTIAIVGTREATENRKKFVKELSADLADRGYTIVSGLAIGVDAAAHAGALEAQGNTFAILPGSLETIYPKSNSDLAKEITRDGALVSEMSKFSTMHRGRYLERNRITSGISDAIIVGASRNTGGTIKQIQKAKEQGIPRFYYNSNLDDGQSPKKLEELGCKPFTAKDELIELIQDRESLFDTTTTKRVTLSEF